MGLAAIWGRAMYPEMAEVFGGPNGAASQARDDHLDVKHSSLMPAQSPQSCVQPPVPADDLVTADPKGVGPPLPLYLAPGDVPGVVADEAGVHLGV